MKREEDPLRTRQRSWNNCIETMKREEEEDYIIRRAFCDLEACSFLLHDMTGGLHLPCNLARNLSLSLSLWVRTRHPRRRDTHEEKWCTKSFVVVLSIPQSCYWTNPVRCSMLEQLTSVFQQKVVAGQHSFYSRHAFQILLQHKFFSNSIPSIFWAKRWRMRWQEW